MKKVILPHTMSLLVVLLFALGVKGQEITAPDDTSRNEKINSLLIMFPWGPDFKAGGEVTADKQFGFGLGLGLMKDLMFVSLNANFKSFFRSQDSVKFYRVIKASAAEFDYNIGAPRSLSKLLAGTGVGFTGQIKFTDIGDGNLTPFSGSFFWQLSLNEPWPVGKTPKFGNLYFGLSGRIYYLLEKDPETNGPAGFTGRYQIRLTVYVR